MPKKPGPLPQWQSANIEPKRKYKFILSMGEVTAWLVKTAGRPKLNVSEGAKHHFLAHQFKFPGRVTWDDIEISLVDPIDPDVAFEMLRIIEKAGYVLPSQWTIDNEGYKKSLSKKNFINDNLGNIVIKTVDSDGAEVERWTLHNAWVKSIDYDDASYDSEELMQIKVGLTYDYAELQLTGE